MKVLLASIAMLLLVGQIRGQADPPLLPKEVENKLKDHLATPSEILTDKQYLFLHHYTSFRELIKKYASTGQVSIATTDEPGKKIKVVGMISDPQGNPVAGALVYLYQTDARGWYAADAPHVASNEGDMRHARLFGYVKTNDKGQFELHTIKPSGYPGSDLPAHIHVHITAPGYRSFVNEFLFDDDERLKGNIRENSSRNGFLIAKPQAATAPFQQLFSYSITLAKDR